MIWRCDVEGGDDEVVFRLMILGLLRRLVGFVGLLGEVLFLVQWTVLVADTWTD